ncbi:MAG: hypothetical protein IPM39_29460 [Chloroflexi bacterium]|nr:hypothetical protein [Chloroflexota bacterium]
MMQQQQPLPGLPAEPAPIYDQTHPAERALFELMLGDFPWSDTYLALLEEGWEWRKAAYIAWASLPATSRRPPSLGQFADVIGLATTKQIRAWRLKNKAIDLAVQRLSLSNLLDDAPAVIQALIDSASDANYKAAPDRKLFFEMTGMYVPRSRLGLALDTTEDDADMSSLSRDDLARLAGMGTADDE